MTAGTAEKPVQAVPEPLPEPDEQGLSVKAFEQLTLEVGGKAPTASSLRLVGGKIDVDGAFRKGAKLKLEVECHVGEITFKDDVDAATGQTVGCHRTHKARITGLRVVSDRG